MNRAALLIEQEALLQLAHGAVRAIEPGARVILYGSRARGDGDWESDWDLLILLDGPVDIARKDALHTRLHELSLDTGEVLSALVFSQDDWRSPRWSVAPIHANIEDDGIDLATMTPARGLGSTHCSVAAMAEARDELASEWMARARVSLTAAAVLAESELWNESVGRLYYACFDAVRALLLQRGYRFSKHSSVQSAFNRDFVKTGMVPVDLGDLYNTLFTSRGRADYEAFVRFGEAQVRTWIAETDGFIRFIEGMLAPENPT